MAESRSDPARSTGSKTRNRGIEEQALSPLKDEDLEFERHRHRLMALAQRMLHDRAAAEEIVQDAWIRRNSASASEIRTPGAWLTTVVTRLCLDELRARKRRLQAASTVDDGVRDTASEDPERDLVLKDSVGAAMLIVIDRLSAIERVTFILREVLDMGFDEIAPLIERSEVAARQIASRARRRVHGCGKSGLPADVVRRRLLAEAFLKAARSGDPGNLIRLLATDVVLRPDAEAARLAASGDIRGATAVATFFARQRATAAHVALVDGSVGLIVAPQDRLSLVLKLTFAGNKIAGIDAIASPATLAKVELALGDEPRVDLARQPMHKKQSGGARSGHRRSGEIGIRSRRNP